MNRIVEELKKTGVFYLATVDADGHPHVRPFGAVTEFEGKVYLCTNITKNCYAEMLAEPRIEISGMEPDSTWIRVTGKVVRDDREEARAAVLDDNPNLKEMYRVNDGIFEVLYLDDAECTKYSFTEDPVIIK